MRKSIKNAYITAFLISIFLFLMGIMVGYFIQKSISQGTDEKLNKLQNKIEDVQLQYIYLNIMNENDCDFGSILLDEATQELWNINKELTLFENKVSKEDMEILEKKYFLLSAKAWILNSYISKHCEQDSLPILYFYSVPCKECEKQGEILDSIQNFEFKDKIRIFVMNINSEEKIVQTIKKTYNITLTPTIIINEKKYEGLIEQEPLKEMVVENLKH